MGWRHGDYYLIDQRTGFKIRRSEAVLDAYGYIVKAGTEDPRHPQESIRPTRIAKPPKFVSPEGTDTFLDPNDVLESDF